MMRRIYKYELPIAVEDITFSLHEGAEFLSFQNQAGKPVMWLGADLDRSLAPRTFYLRGTGYDYPSGAIYRGTAQFNNGALVLHLFERPQ